MAEPVVRGILKQLFQSALHKVRGSTCVSDFFSGDRPGGEIHMAAVGKAAESMARGALDSLGQQVVRALVIARRGTRDEPLQPRPGLAVMEAAHPVPDQSSLDAGLALRDFVAAVPPAATLLLLVSGGASSLVEVPRHGISLRDVQRLNRYLLGSGLDIHRCNALRRTLSRIKGGGLLDFFHGRDLWCLLISDVPGDDPSDIGSGLVLPGNGACSLDGLPDWAVELAGRGGNPVDVSARVAPRVLRVLASNFDALQAASETAKRSGLRLARPFGRLSGDAREQGRTMGRTLRRCAPGLYLWGGETTVRLPPRPGRGGRNQHLALALAGELGGKDQVTVLVSGSDGNDGDGPWAGAIVDGGTRSRGEAAGMDLERCLADADSGRFLEASGDLLWTGATGTNVCDLAIALVGSPPPQLR